MKRSAVLGLLIAMACTGGGQPAPSHSPLPDTPTPSRSPRFEEDVGFLVFGAEQWPQCLNPITACAASDWTWYTVLEHVLPRAMQLDQRGNFIASPMLDHAPSLANGEVTENPFTVTFRINDKAVWEDGSPITSADFDFTWRAIVSTSGSFRTDGYDLIESIDTRNPKIAVINFRDVYVDWPDLFGGGRGFVLKVAAFPRQADDPTPDLRSEMTIAIPFSGGPWILSNWSRDAAVLMRNERYFGTIPLVDQVEFVPRTDPAREFKSFLDGETYAIYPQPLETSLIDSCCPGPVAKGGKGTAFVGLWFNLSMPPLNRLEVRQALMYAIDRQAVVDQLVKLNDPNGEVLNCGFLALPTLGAWCRDRPFARYTYDPEKARAMLEAAGYDCSKTPCTKKGKPLAMDYFTSSTNLLLLATQKVLVEHAAAAGFELRPKQQGESSLFGPLPCLFRGPVAGCSRVVSPDPSVTDLFSCTQIPSGTNSFVGHDFSRWCDGEAEQLMKRSDRELDPAARLDLMSQIYELQADAAIGLPLFQYPAVTDWREDKIAGPIGAWNGTPYGTFFNMNEWYLAPT